MVPFTKIYLPAGYLNTVDMEKFKCFEKHMATPFVLFTALER